MHSAAPTVQAYLAELAADRRAVVDAVRKVVLANLDDDYEEGMQYGMIGYYVPHAVFPKGYHCDPKQPLPFAAIASQKNHLSLYLCSLYSDAADGDETSARWFRDAWAKTGKKLDMGKSCIRFKRVEDLALDVIGAAIQRMPTRQFIERYEAGLAMSRANRTNIRAKTSSTQAAAKPVVAPRRKTTIRVTRDD
jgi:Domain of unknown function (DU1801)